MVKACTIAYSYTLPAYISPLHTSGIYIVGYCSMLGLVAFTPLSFLYCHTVSPLYGSSTVLIYFIRALFHKVVLCLALILAPVGPPKVSLLNTSTTWVQIMWKPPFNPENLTLNFGLTYQLLNSSLPVSTPRPKTTITNIDSYQTTFTLRPLLQGSQYRIVMYTITAQGTSPQSDQLLITTQHSGICTLVQLVS